MNPAYDPFDPMAQRPAFAPGGDTGAFAGGSIPQEQFTARRLAQSPGTQGGSPPVARPRPQYYGGGNVGQSAPGSKSPTGNPVDPKNQFGFQGTYDQWRQSMVPEHPWMSDTSTQWGGGPQGYLPIGYQAQPFSYYQQRDAGGNVAQGPGVQINTGTHTRWHPSGGYGQMAPWEMQYAADTWTQNYDPNQPGYIGTRG